MRDVTWTKFNIIKEKLPRRREAVRHQRAAAARPSGCAKDTVALPEGSAASFLDGAGRRPAPGDRDSIMVLRLPDVYSVRAEIEINPPQIDPLLSTLVSHEIGRSDPTTQASYIPNREARLRSKELAQKVVEHPTIVQAVSHYADPAVELFKSLMVLQARKNSNSFIVTLEGGDPALTKLLLQILLEKFKSQAEEENDSKLSATEDYAKRNLKVLIDDLAELEKTISEAMQKTRTVGPGGRSILEDEYISLGTLMSQKTHADKPAPSATDDVADVSQVRGRRGRRRPRGAAGRS